MRIALAQLACVEGDTRHNLETARQAVDEAARLKTDCVVLPELHLTGFVAPDRLPHVAEAWPGHTLAGLIERAASRRMGLCTSFVEAAEDGSVSNTAVLAGPDGRILSTYRKTHLFDAERRLYTPGNELAEPVDFLGAATGLLVCYDVEFPEAARILALAGAERILIPSANMAPWGPRHRVFVTARALENHLFVAYCNRCGEGPGMTYCGGSVIIDPMGEVLCEAGAEEAVICAEIDMDVLTKSTEVFDYRLERRPDLYDQLGS
jgi:predicted amidohydrolase